MKDEYDINTRKAPRCWQSCALEEQRPPGEPIKTCWSNLDQHKKDLVISEALKSLPDPKPLPQTTFRDVLAQHQAKTKKKRRICQKARNIAIVPLLLLSILAQFFCIIIAFARHEGAIMFLGICLSAILPWMISGIHVLSKQKERRLKKSVDFLSRYRCTTSQYEDRGARSKVANKKRLGQVLSLVSMILWLAAPLVILEVFPGGNVSKSIPVGIAIANGMIPYSVSHKRIGGVSIKRTRAVFYEVIETKIPPQPSTFQFQSPLLAVLLDVNKPKDSQVHSN